MSGMVGKGRRRGLEQRIVPRSRRVGSHRVVIFQCYARSLGPLGVRVAEASGTKEISTWEGKSSSLRLFMIAFVFWESGTWTVIGGSCVGW